MTDTWPSRAPFRRRPTAYEVDCPSLVENVTSATSTACMAAWRWIAS